MFLIILCYVGITSQRGFKLVVPSSLQEQDKVIEIMGKVDENLNTIDSKIFQSKSLQKSIINQIF
tara:strand:- start:116 stop:310 length:195 start_codon:yes stop_codon:yes gene_type:complete